MKPTPRHIQTVYLTLLLLNTLAASFIWGVNTLFLLDAGLNNTQAFLANAFFTIGQVIFEVPTGIIADLKGRRTSYLLGTFVLALTTLMYLGIWYIHGPMWMWAISSILLGLGFTFFSGATEAWLVDALEFAGFKGNLEEVFGKGQMIGGGAMLVGAVGGGFIAQMTNLSIPYLLRAFLLLITFGVAFVYMHDWGFERGKSVDIIGDTKKLFTSSFQFGWSRPPIRWLMISAPFVSGVSFYAFYAMQPYLLQLYGDSTAYGVAGLAAAIVALSQVAGGFGVRYVKKYFKSRTTVLIISGIISILALILVGMTESFALAIILLSIWGLISSLAQPVRQAYLNSLIPSKQRATVLSFDSLVSSSGGVFIQPILGKVADVANYSLSFLIGAIFQALSIPFLFLVKEKKSEADKL